MERSLPRLGERLLDTFDPFRLARWFARRGVRLGFAWLVALLAGGIALEYAWTVYNDPRRGDGNWGHANIDFGGQWLMGRMLVAGHGHHLYERVHLEAVLRESFPRSLAAPDAPMSDADQLLEAMSTQNDRAAATALASVLAPLGAADPVAEAALLVAGERAWSAERLELAASLRVGGPLYPPVHALLYAPLGLLPPQPAYRVMQVLNLLLVFTAGWLVARLSGGRVWWPVASFLLMVFPSFAAAINLGQNPVLSLTLLLLGWWQLTRGRPVRAGLVWGLLAYKPVWAVAFLLAPLLMRRWRFAAAMACTGAGLILLTLPLVGWRSWLDWLAVGRAAAHGYASFETWVVLSRDLLNLFRRWLLHFDQGQALDPDRLLPTLLGLALWLSVLATTVLGSLFNRHPTPLAGPPATFFLLGAWLSCYHFMYYDVYLAALPVCLLFTDSCWMRNPLPPTLLALLIGLSYLCPFVDPTWHFPPCDTFCLLALWAWCGYHIIHHGNTEKKDLPQSRKAAKEE